MFRNVRKLGLALLSSVALVQTFAAPEPNAEEAQLWWPEMRNVFTPVGWPSHLFRYNVLFDGTIIAEPQLLPGKAATRAYGKQGCQLTFSVSGNGAIPELPTEAHDLYTRPLGAMGNQGWTTNATPVLWTDWPMKQGLVLRQEIFAHTPGARAIETGVEPLFAWIRLSVRDVYEMGGPAFTHFVIQLSSPYINRSTSKEFGLNLGAFPDRAPYPRALKAETFQDGSRTGHRILEPDGRVRLVVLPTESKSVSFVHPDPQSSVYYLVLKLPGRKGAHVDLLLPMLPSEREPLEREIKIGFDAALKESDAFWSVEPKTAARIKTPEPQVNEAVARTVKHAQINAERNPNSGEKSFLLGSWFYARLWATPISMHAHMLLDHLGHHDFVADHIELFRAQQGTVIPPGPAYTLHPGYFSSPKSLSGIDWLSDHGAILHMVSRHALVTDDPQFTARWLPAILKGCEFIKDFCALTNHDGVTGLLPPGAANDLKIPVQSVWNMAWNYKGLTSAVKLLERHKHPRAAEFDAEARRFKSTFQEAFREKAATMPTWIDRSGRKRPVVPDMLTGSGLEPSQLYYIDTGPLVLVWAGLMEADDELMSAARDYFREGPNTVLFDRRGIYGAPATSGMRPVLIHEISSVEPCYSWNIYHSWQLADRQRFFEGMYSVLSGGISSQTYSGSEFRHGVSGIVAPNALFVDLARLAVIDDQLRENELHLLRLCPLAWISKEKETVFENIATEFGPVSLRWQLSKDGKTLDVKYQPQFRHKPGKVILHVPPLADLKAVVLNGKKYSVRSGASIKVP